MKNVFEQVLGTIEDGQDLYEQVRGGRSGRARFTRTGNVVGKGAGKNYSNFCSSLVWGVKNGYERNKKFVRAGEKCVQGRAKTSGLRT